MRVRKIIKCVKNVVMTSLFVVIFLWFYRHTTYLTISVNIDDASTAGDQNIFFIETSDTLYHNINSRQPCSIESAALTNPDANIFLLLLSKQSYSKLKDSSNVRAIRSYGNVNLNYLNLKDFSLNTPMEEFLRSGELERSKFAVSHTSDVLRFLILWKFGGTYLDLDVIVRRPINFTNFACIESAPPLSVVPGIMGLNKNYGREIAEKLMKEQRDHFNGSIWGRNGPEVMTKVAKTLCHLGPTNKTAECENFKLLPTDQCYEIHYREAIKFYNELYAEEVKERTKNSHFVHFWNKMMRNVILDVDSEAAYVSFAKEFCPKVLNSCGKYF